MMTQIEAALVLRNEQGEWLHPDYPEFEDSDQIRAWLKEQSLQVLIGLLELDARDSAQAIYKAFLAGDRLALAGWEAESPGDGWFALTVGDSEEGPSWVWARRMEDKVVAE